MTDEEMCALAREMPRGVTTRALCAGDAAVRGWINLTGDQASVLQRVTMELSFIADGALPRLNRMRLQSA